MAKAKCKCKKAECEECPEWIFTFADLVMLMMGFFVILWVLKPPAGKDGEPPRALPVPETAEIKKAFGYVPDPNSTNPIDQYLTGQYQKKPHGSSDGGKSTQEKEGKRGTEPDVQSIRPSKAVGTGGKILFDAGDAKLSGESTRVLDELAETIKGFTNIFIVKGHAAADDFPDGGDDRQKMALSVARAQAAADYLVTRGVARDTIRVQGCATYEPVVRPAYTAEERSLNRRVEVEATGTLVKERQDGPKAKAASAPSAPHAAPAAGHGGH